MNHQLNRSVRIESGILINLGWGARDYTTTILKPISRLYLSINRCLLQRNVPYCGQGINSSAPKWKENKNVRNWEAPTSRARNQVLSWRLLRKEKLVVVCLKRTIRGTNCIPQKGNKSHSHHVRWIHINGTTSRRNSPTRSSSLRSGRRRPLSAAGPSCSSGRWSWRRPGVCWWGELSLPSPGFPSRHLGQPSGL